MKRLSLAFIGLLTIALLPVLSAAQESPKDQGLKTITPAALEGPLEFLASDWMMGRETGTAGEFMASDYIASMYKSMGLMPGGMSSRFRPGYFQDINFIQTTPGSRQECSVIRKSGGGHQQLDLVNKTDFTLSPGSQSIETEGQVVFVGYGIQDKKLKQNDYKGLDLKGKILIRLSGYPGWMDPDSKSFKRFNSPDPVSYRLLDPKKDSIALALGAVAIIEIRRGSAGFNPSPDNIPFRYNTATYEGDVPFNSQPRTRTALQSVPGPSLTRIALSDRALNFLIEGTGIDFAAYEIMAANLAVKPMSLPADRYIKFATSVESKIVRGRNVIGVLEGKDTKSCIVVGAHYDHMGKVNGFVYNGSDDNASGTSGVMAIARAMIATGEKPAVTVVFCAWTAEEKGLLGSEYFARNPYLDNIRCYMNYDMISRTAPDDTTGMKCDFNYSSGLPFLREITEKHIKDYSINLTMEYKTSERPSGGSDFGSFAKRDIPIFLIHGKFTPDYHQYTDHSEKAVMPYYTEIVKLGYLNIYELANKNW